MKRLSAFILIAFCSSSQVVAQDNGWFTTAQFGRADFNTSQKGANPFIDDTDDEAFSWALGLGYYFNRHFGIRGMFERSTDHATTNRCAAAVCPAVLIQGDTDFNNWSLVALPRLPLSSRANLYGTIGLQYLDADSGPQLPDDDDFEFLFGGGLEYSLTRSLSIGGEAQASAADYLAPRFVICYSFY